MMCTFCFKDLSPDELQDTKPKGCHWNAASIKNEKKTGRSTCETIVHVPRVEWMKGFPTITKVPAIYLFIYCFHFPATLDLRRLPTLKAHAPTECRWKLRSCTTHSSPTTKSTEIRQIAHYLTRSHRHTRIWTECGSITWFVVIEIIKSTVPNNPM